MTFLHDLIIKRRESDTNQDRNTCCVSFNTFILSNITKVFRPEKETANQAIGNIYKKEQALH